jgi:WD40 repeat protein
MVNKSFRLSNGYWHKFLPNTNKFLSPQTVKIEIWEIENKNIIEKWHPGILGIKSVAFSNRGDKFVFHASLEYAISKFKIYESDTKKCINEFDIMEECTNAIFTKDDKHLIFATWDGNIYCFNIDENVLKKIFSLENNLFRHINSGEHDNLLYITSTEINAQNNNQAVGFIFEYDIFKNDGNRINFTNKRNPYEINGKINPTINGLSLNNKKLAILTSFISEENKDCRETKVYIYDTQNKKVSLVKENFKTGDMFYDNDSITWSNNGKKLAFIGLNEIFIIEDNKEQKIVTEEPTSVAFSNCDTCIAVGGGKAKLIKL